MSLHEYTGSCLCGAVRYSLKGKGDELRGITACHCNQCRKWSGHHWASLNGPMAGFAITKGEDSLRWYKSSNKARRGFCSACGSALFWHGEGYQSFKTWISVAAGSLDDSKGRTLVRHIFCESKGRYYELKDGAPIYDTFPQNAD